MTYTKEVVMSIVRDFLGDNAQGVYIPSEEYEWGMSDLCAVSEMDEDGIAWEIEEITGFDLCRGATKVVIVPINEDYVIKLNITGTYLTKEQCRDAGLSYPCIDRTASSDTMDYENALYEDIPEELQSIIKPNILIGEYRGMPIYIQEKIKTTYENCCHVVEKCYENADQQLVTSVQSIVANTCPAGYRSSILPEAFICDMVKAFGEQLTEQMLLQLKESSIYDLNFGNFGYDKSDKPCLFDIGGFDEGEFFN